MTFIRKLKQKKFKMLQTCRNLFISSANKKEDILENTKISSVLEKMENTMEVKWMECMSVKY